MIASNLTVQKIWSTPADPHDFSYTNCLTQSPVEMYLSVKSLQKLLSNLKQNLYSDQIPLSEENPNQILEHFRPEVKVVVYKDYYNSTLVAFPEDNLLNSIDAAIPWREDFSFIDFTRAKQFFWLQPL